MAVRKRSNPDKEECLKILSEIEGMIPSFYGNKVLEVLEKKGVEEIPTQYQIQSARHGRIYDLEIMQALKEVAKQAEAERKKAEREKKGEIGLFKKTPLNS